jgi:uncharacterized protein YkwD
MSAERRRRDDSLPIDERATDAQGRPGSRRAGDAWSAEFHHDDGGRRGGRDDWPGDPQADQAWASSYRFDGRRSDEPWRDPSQREDNSPAGRAWRHDALADDGPASDRQASDGQAGDAADSWIDRTPADQSWRYRSLADDQLTAEQDDDWPGLEPPAGPGRHGAAGAGRRASDSWPASTRADESWRDSTAPGAAYRDAAGPGDTGLDATDPRGAWRPATDPGAVIRNRPQADEPWRDSSRAGASGSYAMDPRAVDLTAGGLAVDPFATDLYAGDYADPSRPSGTHVVGGRRASDNWLAGNPAGPGVPEVDAPGRPSLAGGGQPGGGWDDGGHSGDGQPGDGWDDGGQPGGGRPGDDWDDGGRPGGRRRILVSVMAAVAVALAFGAYGLVRMHDSSTLALQDSSSRPCAAHSGRCHSHHPPRTPAPGSSSPAGISSAPTGSGSPTTGASGSPSTQPTHSAPPASMPASVPPPTHSAPPPPVKPTPKPSASASQPSGTASSAAAAQVLTVINQARAQQGLPALAISSGLNTSSAAHTSVMAGDCGLSHQCPGEPPLGTRISNAGVQWTSAGENIGEGGPVANDTSAITQMAVNLTQSMLNEKPPDDGHRMNILSSSFRFIGITVFIDAKGTVWMTQDFSG